jgi:hypothetical protein
MTITAKLCSFRPPLKSLIAWAGALVLAANAVAQSPADTKDARDERVSSYLRSGRYADARRLIDEILRTEARADLRNVLAVFGSNPNMRVRRAAATFACEVSETGVLLPLTVNGRRADWLLDTGANVSIISDAEAARLGLVIRASEGRAADLAGGSTGVRLAIAKRVAIGRTQLGDVPFLVTPADQMPWKELPPGKQGIAGLPLAIALDALRWTRTGTCHTGSAALHNGSAAPPSNLRYDNLHVVTSVEGGSTLRTDFYAHIRAVYLTPLTLDEKFRAQMIQDDSDWGKFVLQVMLKGEVPPKFLLRQMPNGYLPNQFLLMDRDRWNDKQK